MTLFLCFAILTVQFQKTNWVDSCRESLIKIQSKNAAFMSDLLALNPRAKQLRIEVIIIQQQILLAVTTGQLEVLPLLKLKLKNLKLQQRSLDQIQKKIIATAKQVAQYGIIKSRQDLKSSINSDYLKSLGWVVVKHQFAPLPKANFALKPEDSNLAPTYSAYHNFERSQSLAHSWESQYNWPKFIESAIGKTVIKSQCRISIKEGLWKAIIQRDRL